MEHYNTWTLQISEMHWCSDNRLAWPAWLLQSRRCDMFTFDGWVGNWPPMQMNIKSVTIQHFPVRQNDFFGCTSNIKNGIFPFLVPRDFWFSKPQTNHHQTFFHHSSYKLQIPFSVYDNRDRIGSPWTSTVPFKSIIICHFPHQI